MLFPTPFQLIEDDDEEEDEPILMSKAIQGALRLFEG